MLPARDWIRPTPLTSRHVPGDFSFLWMYRSLSRICSLFSRDFVILTRRQARKIMIPGNELRGTLEKQAKEAEETVSLLKSQLVLLQRAAGVFVTLERANLGLVMFLTYFQGTRQTIMC